MGGCATQGLADPDPWVETHGYIRWSLCDEDPAAALGQSGNENVGVEAGSYLDLEKHPATVIPAEVEDYVQSGSGWILGRLLTMHSSCFTNTGNASPLTRHAVRIQLVIL